MVSLTPIETVGYDLAFFTLPEIEDNGAVFTYYTFDTTAPPALANYWNLMGLHWLSSEPLLLDVRIMQIGDDELPLDAFDPRYASSLLLIKPAEFLGLIQFFEEKLGHFQRRKATPSSASFHVVDADELMLLRLPLWEIKRKTGDYYRYTPDENVQSSDKISLIHFPQWSSGYNFASLMFLTFDQAWLVDPRFNPFNAVTLEWPGTMSFDEGGLEAFILLLKQYIYERMVGGS